MFLLLTTGITCELRIPGQPFSFAELYSAQAEGDFQVLQAKQRRILHLHLADESPKTLSNLKTLLDQSLVGNVDRK